MTKIDGLIPTRQSLLTRLKDWNDQESWKSFFDTYWRLIYNTAIQAGLTDAEAQDVVQETVIQASRRLQNFKYDAKRGSFKGWLLRMTGWRIIDQLRRRTLETEPGNHNSTTSTETSTLERMPDPEGLSLEETWDVEWESNLMEAAIERVKKKIDAKVYQVFDLYVFKGWSVRSVARTLGVNPGWVYLTKHRVGKLLKQEIILLRTKLI